MYAIICKVHELHLFILLIFVLFRHPQSGSTFLQSRRLWLLAALTVFTNFSLAFTEPHARDEAVKIHFPPTTANKNLITKENFRFHSEKPRKFAFSEGFQVAGKRKCDEEN